MKIRTIPGRKVYTGTPIDIVRKMAADAIFLNETPEEYIEGVARRLPTIKIEGDTFEEKCKSFLDCMMQTGDAEILQP